MSVKHVGSTKGTPPGPPSGLSADEAEVLAAYREMTPWARGMLVELAAGWAKDFPLPRPAPVLRLVVGKLAMVRA